MPPIPSKGSPKERAQLFARREDAAQFRAEVYAINTVQQEREERAFTAFQEARNSPSKPVTMMVPPPNSPEALQQQAGTPMVHELPAEKTPPSQVPLSGSNSPRKTSRGAFTSSARRDSALAQKTPSEQLPPWTVAPSPMAVEPAQNEATGRVVPEAAPPTTEMQRELVAEQCYHEQTATVSDGVDPDDEVTALLQISTELAMDVEPPAAPSSSPPLAPSPPTVPMDLPPSLPALSLLTTSTAALPLPPLSASEALILAKAATPLTAADIVQGTATQYRFGV